MSARTARDVGARPVKVPPWEPDPRWSDDGVLVSVRSGDTELARYVDGAGSPAFDAPRPYLHPVRTPGGVVVTEAAPLDHTWHLGLGLGVPDVAGHNLWGGRTYVRGDGYTWRRDHGRVVHTGWERRSPGRVAHRLEWRGADDVPLLLERRELAWTVGDDAWRLDVVSDLAVPAGAAPVPLGSPATNGRTGAGYGGMLWRLPACTDVDVRTPLGRGEDAVHGSVPADGASWLAWSATVAGRDVTLVAAPADEATAHDPWFVRVADYPGLGSALAWAEPLVVTEQRPVRRAFTFLVADGRWEDGRVADAVDAAPPRALRTP